MKKQRIIILGLLIILSILTGCNQQAVEIDESTAFNNNQNYEHLTPEDKAFLELMEELGIDINTLGEQKQTDDGAKVIGDARPAKAFRSLGEAEDAFGYYLGFHNTIESVDNDTYELIGIYIIENDFMQAVYDNNDQTKKLVVKLAINSETDDLINVYFENGEIGYDKEDKIHNVNYRLYKNDKETDIYNLVWFKTEDGKAYSIDTKTGLKEKEIRSLLDELIWNVITMPEKIRGH